MRVIIRTVADRWDEIMLAMAHSNSKIVPVFRLEAEYAADLHIQLVDADERSHKGVLNVRAASMKFRLEERDWRALLAALSDWSLRFEAEEDFGGKDGWPG